MKQPSFGLTNFCDDIRTEADGKITYVGCYPDGMGIQSFPVVIPKFAFGLICYYAPKVEGNPPMSAIVNIFLPGDPEDQPSIKSEDLVLGKPPIRDMFPPLSPGDQSFVGIRANIVTNFLPLKEAGRIKVRVLVNNEEIIKCGALIIQHIPAAPT